LDGVAVRDVGFRRRLFEETGSRMNLDPFIVEKDFWVCWTLNRLFNLPDLRKQLVFRGGTSLSKVYGVIHLPLIQGNHGYPFGVGIEYK